MSELQIKTPEKQLEEQIRDVIWNVYRKEDEDKEGGAVDYRMNRVMKLIKEYEQQLLARVEEIVYSSRDEHVVREALAELRQLNGGKK